MRYHLFLLTLTLLFQQISWADVIDLKVEDLPKLLLERNQNVQGVKLSIQASEQRTGYLLRAYLPTLNIEAGTERFQTGSYLERTEPYGSIETRINLFRGGKDTLEERIRQAQVKLTSAHAQRTIIDELSDARKTYWTLVFQREVVNILKDALQENEASLEAAKRRIKRGLVGDADQVDFEINRDVLQEEISSQLHEIELTQIKLRSFFSWGDEKVIQTTDIIPHDHDEALLEKQPFPSANPDVSLIQANSEISSWQSSQSRRWWTPSLDLYAGTYLYTLRDRDYVDISRRDDYVIGAKLSFPLFDGLQSKAQASYLALQADALGSQAKHREKVVLAKIQIAKEELKHHHELTHTAENRIRMGEKYLAKTLSEYDRGIKNSPDVLGALQRKISFKRRHAEIKRDYQLFKADLLALLNY